MLIDQLGFMMRVTNPSLLKKKKDAHTQSVVYELEDTMKCEGVQ